MKEKLLLKQDENSVEVLYYDKYALIVYSNYENNEDQLKQTKEQVENQIKNISNTDIFYLNINTGSCAVEKEDNVFKFLNQEEFNLLIGYPDDNITSFMLVISFFKGEKLITFEFEIELG